MSGNAGVSVREVSSRDDVARWLEVPHIVFAGDPQWIAPLHLAERQRISRRHNPFFKYGDAAFFVAERLGRPVGRISAQINRLFHERHGDGVGHFGFFECQDDPLVAQALIEQAAAWLRSRGMREMVGPYSLTINQESGLLVDGFDSPPAIMMPHGLSCYDRLLHSCGLEKAIDLLAFRMSPHSAPTQILRLARLASESPRVKLRRLDMGRYQQEVELVAQIFNDAWSENYGFVPFGEHDVRYLASEMRPIMRGKFGRVVEIDGVAAAMMIVLPDLNDVIAPYAGRLAPFNWLRLARAIWRDKWKTARIPLLGVTRAHRHTPMAPAVLSMMVADILDLGRSYDLDWVEFSWVLETNRPMVQLAELAAGPPCKRYRLYTLNLERSDLSGHQCSGNGNAMM